MSLVVAWISVDCKKKRRKDVSAIYFGSDSRFTWWDGYIKYDRCKKLYWSKNFPEIFAFAGSVDFPKYVLSTICNYIDRQIIVLPENDAVSKSNIIIDRIQQLKAHFRPLGEDETCTILYGTKCNGSFSIFSYRINQHEVLMQPLTLPPCSGLVEAIGTGNLEFINRLSVVNSRSNESKTSRGVFHCLWNTIETTAEESIGGVIQVVGLYRGKSTPQVIGILKDGILYVNSKEVVDENAELCELEWRDVDFQRIDPETKQLIEGAQQQPFVE